MNYFYFQQFLLDLLENKYISKNKENESSEEVFSITSSGKYTLELTSDLLPGILKFKIDSTVNGELQEIEEQFSIVSEFMPEDDGGFIVTCKIIENNKSIFEVSTFAASREQAKFISDNWKQNATMIESIPLKVPKTRKWVSPKRDQA